MSTLALVERCGGSEPLLLLLHAVVCVLHWVLLERGVAVAWVLLLVGEPLLLLPLPGRVLLLLLLKVPGPLLQGRWRARSIPGQ